LPEYVVEPKFKKRLQKKQPKLQAAILETIARLAENPRHPGLRTHELQGRDGVYEAYIDVSNRLTFHYDEHGRIVLRNHCNHSIVDRSP
jgi:mRNA-degrading endonuclease YafQ of YafQ-DinJ toxin-antitoxin module